MRVNKKTEYYIDNLKPKELSYFISFSLILLENFPHRLNKYYKKNKLLNLHTILDKYRNKKLNIPNWYLSSIYYNTISTRWL